MNLHTVRENVSVILVEYYFVQLLCKRENKRAENVLSKIPRPFPRL